MKHNYRAKQAMIYQDYARMCAQNNALSTFARLLTTYFLSATGPQLEGNL